MKLPSEELNEQIIFIDKPAGIDVPQWKPELYPTHRLVNEMTGCQVLAKTPQAAQKLCRLLRSRQLQAKYLFVTDRAYPGEKIHVSPFFHFQRVKRSPFFELWEVTASSCRPRQIQLLASSLNLPILGDVSRGGSPFPHLCLHALELEIPLVGKGTSFEPIFMKRLGFLKDPALIEALSKIDQHQRQFDFLRKPPAKPGISHRLIDQTEIQVDLLDNQLSVHWNKKNPPSLGDRERWSFISQLLRKKLIFSHSSEEED